MADFSVADSVFEFCSGTPNITYSPFYMFMLDIYNFLTFGVNLIQYGRHSKSTFADTKNGYKSLSFTNIYGS